jgi:ABC-type branched-subunit amino acid transport system substrate-binding protein
MVKLRKTWSLGIAVVAVGLTTVLVPTGAASAKATKTPIVLGFLGGPAGLGFVDFDPTVQAAVKYENSIGGVDGRPIKEVVCDDEGTPESVTACANTFVSDHVSAVGSQITTNEAALLTPLAAAGIPFIENSPASTALGSADTIGVGVAAIGNLSLAALYGEEHHLTSNAMVLINSASSQAITSAVKPFYDKAGVAFSDELVDPGTPDLTATMEAATATHPASVTILGPTSFCASGLKALNSIGYTGTVLMSSCAGPPLVKSVGSLVNGAVVGDPGGVLGLSKKDSKTYLAAMKKYAKGIDPTVENLSAVFGNVSLTVSVLRKMSAGSSYTGPEVLAAFKALKNFGYFMDGGVTLTCDGKDVSFAPSICSTKIFVFKYKGTREVPLGLLDFKGLFG